MPTEIVTRFVAWPLFDAQSLKGSQKVAKSGEKVAKLATAVLGKQAVDLKKSEQ